MPKLIVANWKSQKSLTQAEAWLQTVHDLLGAFPPDFSLPKDTTIALTPPFPFIVPLRSAIEKLGWQLGVQDISPFPAGSYNGAVSGVNLQGLGVKYTLVGHSERRRYFHETVQTVARKIEQALDVGITPIICVDQQTVEAQAAALDEGLNGQWLVAYEPAQAIGSGHNVPLSEVKEFQSKVQRLFGAVPFLYGGSVDELNISEYLLVTDGAIISTASLDAKQFVTVLKTALGIPKAK